MIVLDHCTPRRYLRLLHEWGYPATLMTDHIPPDSTDYAVIELAQSLDAILLTVDLDFANILDYPPQSHVGVIVLRYAPSEEDQIDITLKQLLSDLYRDGLRSSLIVVSAGKYRVRHG